MIVNQTPYPINFEMKTAQALTCRYGEVGRQYKFIADIDLTGLSANVQVIKPDGTFVIEEATVTVTEDEQYIVVEIPLQATVVKGVCRYDINLFQDEDLILYTAEGPLWVDDQLITEDMIESIAEVYGLRFPQDFLTVENLVDIVNYVKAQIIDDQVTNNTQTWSSSKIKNSFDSVNNSVVNLSTTINAMKTGFDGVVYPTPAAQVIGSDTKLQTQTNELHNIFDYVIGGENLFDNVTWTEGHGISADGGIINNVNLRYSSLIPVKTATYFFIYKTKGADITTRIHGYDENGTWLKQITTDASGVDIKINAKEFQCVGVYYIRISTAISQYIEPMYLFENFPVVKYADEINDNIIGIIGKDNALLDVSWVYGYGIHESGSTYSNANLCYSSLIPVENGKYVFEYSPLASGVVTRIHGYDDNGDWVKQLTSTTSTSATGTENLEFICSGVKYIRISTAIIQYIKPISVIKNGTVEYEFDSIRNEMNQIENNVSTFQSSESDSLSTSLSITSVPNIKQNNRIAFYGKLGSFTNIRISHGLTKDYASTYIDITQTELKVYTYPEHEELIGTYTHGLTFADFINVIIEVKSLENALVTISTNDASFSQEIYWRGCYGDVIATITNGPLLDCGLTYGSESYWKDVWAFGDSYFDHWTPIANEKGACNWLVDGFSGRQTPAALSSLELCLQHGKPKYILWCMGMNDIDTGEVINATWKNGVDYIHQYCQDHNITLILSTIPNTPTHHNSRKNAYVKSLGVRYVDIANAVGSDDNDEWYTGMLSADQLHAAMPGRKAIATRVLSDVPEITYNS